MSRRKNFSRNLVTSYVQLAINVAYTIVSIPLIFHWLPKAEFGMWASLVQLMGYMSFIDMGMNSATARLLVEHKDEKSNGNYGSLLKTAFLVSSTQAIVILAVTILVAPLFAVILKVPPEHSGTFSSILNWQGLVTAFIFLMRPLNMMLYAHQRMDLQSYNDIANLIISFFLLIFLLSHGFGIFSFVYANAATALIGSLFLFWSCHRLRLTPKRGEWGAVSSKFFKEVFSYGNKIFLFDLGCQLQFASQTLVVYRAFGPESAAAWAIGTKMFNLAFSLVIRPYGAALPGLMEMLARGESERLKARFRSITMFTASLGAFLACSYVLGNSLFVSLWTSNKIIWPPFNDCLLGVWIFILAMQTTHCTFATVSKQFGAISYVLLAEGIIFILLTFTVGKYGGIAGMICCSIFCTLIFSYQYGIRRSCKYFESSFGEIAFTWLRPTLKFALAYLLLTLATWYATMYFSPLARLITHGLLATTAGILLLLRLGLSQDIVAEIVFRLPYRLAAWMRVIAGVKSQKICLATREN